MSESQLRLRGLLYKISTLVTTYPTSDLVEFGF
jgi:hypothetical protein